MATCLSTACLPKYNTPMSLQKFVISFVVTFVFIFTILPFHPSYAQTNKVSPTVILNEDGEAVSTDEAELVEEVIIPTVAPRPDLTRESEETVEPLVALLNNQHIDSVWPVNHLKLAIRNAVKAGVPVNTIVLLLLLPGVTALIATARHMVGLRGFGIFLPAALSVVFLATGPVVGIGLFLVIVIVSTLMRIFLRRTKIKLQYLPRMSLLLLFVVLGVLGILFLAPVIRHPDITNVSIFPVLILVLLAEEFSKVQLGKSAKTAINLTTETLIISLISFIFLTLQSVQRFALLHPEGFIGTVLLVNVVLSRYVGLRFVEYWRFRKLISG